MVAATERSGDPVGDGAETFSDAASSIGGVSQVRMLRAWGICVFTVRLQVSSATSMAGDAHMGRRARRKGNKVCMLISRMRLCSCP